MGVRGFSDSRHTAAAAWAVGGVFAIGAVIVAALYFTGNSLAALKVLLFLLLVPGVVLFSAAGTATLRQPGWQRRPRDLAAVAFLFGCVLALVPILLFAPWAPERFPLDSMPLGLPIVAMIGIALAFMGAVLGLLLGVHGAWRRRDWGQLGWLVVVAAFVGWLVAAAIEANT